MNLQPSQTMKLTDINLFEATGPEKIPTGAGKSAIVNPAHTPTAKYEGDPAQYNFGAQARNYQALAAALARNGKKLDYIAVATAPIGRDTFVATAPGVVWHKYEGSSPAAGQNYLYVNGVKDKLTSFLSATPEEQDRMLSASSADLSLKKGDAFGYINALATGSESAKQVVTALNQNRELILTRIANELLNNPKLISKVKTFNKTLAAKGALVPWLTLDGLLTELQPMVSKSLFDNFLHWPSSDSKKRIKAAISVGLLNDMQYMHDLFNDNVDEIVKLYSRPTMFTGPGYRMVDNLIELMTLIRYSNPTLEVKNLINNITVSQLAKEIESASKATGNVYQYTRLLLQAGFSKDKLVQIFNDLKEDLIGNALYQLTRTSKVDAISEVSAALNLLGITWPEFNRENLRKLINDKKTDIIRTILTDIKNERFNSSLNAVNFFLDNDYDWPELTAIKRSLVASLNKQTNETQTDLSNEMKILEVEQLDEDLGNLNQLGVGPLINVLKQGHWVRRGGEAEIQPVGKRFAGSGWEKRIGPNSEITDIGAVKDVLKSLRKAFKTTAAVAFAVYIGGKPAMFGLTDEYTLAGSSRYGKIAYDLTPWSETVNLYDQQQKGRYAPSTKLTTARDKEERQYSHPEDRWDNPVMVKQQYAGDMISTGDLSTITKVIEFISANTGEPITVKLVMKDEAGFEKMKSRQINHVAVRSAAEDLKHRLSVYKNSKKPSVDTIEDFIATSLKKPGSVVQFAGVPYRLTATSYDKIDPVSLLSGKEFYADYKSNLKDDYSTYVKLYYRYDKDTNQLLPIYAEWTDKTNPENPKRESAVLDGKGYIKSRLKVQSLTKEAVIPKILELVKSSRFKDALMYVQALRKMDLDWPELSVIERSANAELNKPKA